MKRLYFTLFILLFSVCSVSAQTYGNEWINYSQKYLKVKIVWDGIYRIDSTTMANAVAATGNSLAAIDPRNFQVFYNGTEQYIWVEGDTDGVFNSGDYLEFFGKRNDGTNDTSIYGGASNQLDPFYSLYNDTSVYFITWNSSITNRRFTAPVDTNFSAYTPSNYFTDEEIYAGNSEYLDGVEDPNGVTDPLFLDGEGYYNTTFYYGQSAAIPLNSQHAWNLGPNATVEMKVGSASNDWSTPNDNELQINFPALGSPFDTVYDGYSVWKKYFSFNPSTLSSSTTNFTVSSINSVASVSSGRTGVAYVDLKYPHTFDMEGRIIFEGFLPDNMSGPKALVPMTNMGGSGTVRFYDLFNHQRIDAVNNSGTYSVLVANGNGSEKPFVAAPNSGAVFISSITAVNGNGSFVDYSLSAADSVYIIITNYSLWNAADQYRTYRAGAGGAHNVVMANVSDLYDQFGYGVAGSPLGMRRFCDFLIHNYPSPPQDLLLIGKSMSMEIQRINGYFQQSLVPTFGYPSSDNMITAGLNGTRYEPAIATGRIAARDSASVNMYLQKVIQYESNTPADWMKYVLHFGGGTTTGEQQQFATYLAAYADTITDTLFGGIVQTYLKTSTAPIQINQSDTLRQRIEDGVSIMTFFGHASGTGFDQSIDDPSTYNNNGKYPLVIANSCFAGDIHQPTISSSEAFTFLDHKGTIGYIATVSIGISTFLDVYSRRLYEAIGKTEYGQPIGKCMQWTVNNAENNYTDGVSLRTTLLNMTLQGDPAVVINSFPKPDYEITNANVWFDQLTQPDSVYVYAQITNIGRAINDSFIVEMKRRFPNGDTVSYFQQIAAPKFRDTIMFRIPVDNSRGVGLNTIKITVDFFGHIDEMREDNNTTIPDVDLLIHGSAILPVYPYEFAVVPSDTITLKACSVNPLEPLTTYRFELDTTDLFNSLFKQSYTVTARGGVISWQQPNLFSFSPATDSVVYFWRVSPDSLNANDIFMWRQSSFQCIPNQVGWGQDHIFQFTNDGYQYVTLNRNLREFDFVNNMVNLSVKDGIYNVAVPWNEVWYKLNGSTQHIFSCVFACAGGGVTVAVIDSVSGQPWNFSSPVLGPIPPYNNCVCVPDQTLNAYDFGDGDSTSRDNIRRFIDSIPNGDYVLIYSQYYHHAMEFENGVRNSISQIGPSSLSAGIIPDTVAYIIWGKKGASTPTQEAVGTAQNSVLNFNTNFQTHWNTGFVQSPKIGPASNWGAFYWKEHAFETPDYDSAYVDLYGYNAAGTETYITRFSQTTTSVLNLNSIVDAQTYPYIRLVARMRDDTSHTPPQLDRWHVLYSPAPDLALNPPVDFSFYRDTMQEGENGKLIVAVQNLTPWAFANDTFLYKYWIVDANHNTHNLPQQLKAGPFNPYSWKADTVTFSTTTYVGANELWMEVNPVGYATTQPEQYHFNNVIMVPFNVTSDKTNPLLDVTFDGVHIMNNDIVSGKPQILVTLKDENQFLALNDPNDFNIFLRTPSQSTAQLISWTAGVVSFTPAVLPNNSCKILFTPQCPEDGTYDLIVQAKDRSNNQSGIMDYKISFEVINHATITNVMNYPNPFSTSTRFVFTLTGDEVPDIFTIQIMTITGKVVREINRDELGDLHIGRNVTEYAWDGKDQYGDQLANGIYLYRVITRLNGDAIDHRESGADTYIDHGWGKMYLMR
ncbi:MAG: hypothetical protein HY064_01200 [Bacteroidetes bacterium]|nr:hypothetical protein [Bacteroidota bacterium]